MLDTLTITHDWHDGTTLHGTEKDTPAHHIAKDARSWLWRGGQRVWGVRSSKRQAPKHQVITTITDELRAAGYEVEHDIDETVPAISEREQAEADRWDAITDRHSQAAEKLRTTGNAEAAKAREFYQRIPLGQPILVGHHSEKTDRNRRARANRQMDRGFEAQAAADTRQEKASSAAAHMGARYSPKTVGNRIGNLEAEERALLVKLDGGKPQWHHPHDGGEPWFGTNQPAAEEVRERLGNELSRVRDDLAYWREVRTAHIADGSSVNPETVAKGDWVKVMHEWVPVRRVNKKTVTVPHPMFEWHPETTTRSDGRKEWQEKVPFHKLSGHRKATDVPPESKHDESPHTR